MIITENFVFIHCQKTGGTFVANVLRDLLCPNSNFHIFYRIYRKFNIKVPFFNYKYREMLVKDRDQHGWCNDIPKNDRDKRIVTIIRNPYDYYVSAFKFQWWKRELEGSTPKKVAGFFSDPETVKRLHPEYANWSFADFIDISWEFSKWRNRTLIKYPQMKDMGLLTHRFVYFYCKNHEQIFRAAENYNSFFNAVKSNLYDIDFMKQENLNQELYDFLLSVGYAKSGISFILERKKINTSRKDTEFKSYYNEPLKQRIRETDALLFDLFPYYDN